MNYDSGNGGHWAAGIDTTDRHWFGVGSRTAMFELIPPGGGDGQAYAITIDRYVDREGAERMTRRDADTSHAIDCGPSP